MNHNRTTSLFNAGATIPCMCKSCFDKLQPQPKLAQTSTYRVICANGNGLGPIEMTTHALKFTKKFHHQFIVCKHLLLPVILGLDFSHNYLIGIDWLSPNQLHIHQGPKSIARLDPAPFPLHVNHISILPLPHILVKMASQVTIPPRMLVIIPTTFNSIPKPNCHYSMIVINLAYVATISTPCTCPQNFW